MGISLLQKKLLISATLIVFGYQFTLPDTSAQQETEHAPSSDRPASDQPEDPAKNKTRSRDELLAFLKIVQPLKGVCNEQSGSLLDLGLTLEAYQTQYADKEKIEKQVKIQLDEFRKQIKHDFSLSEDEKSELIANEEKIIRAREKLTEIDLRDAIDDRRHELIGLRIRKTILLLHKKTVGPLQKKWMQVIETKQQDEKYTFRKRRTTAERQSLYLQLAYVEFLKFIQESHELNAKKIDEILRQFHRQLNSAIVKREHPNATTSESKLIKPEPEEIESIGLRIEADRAGVEFLESLAIHQLRNHEELVRIKTEVTRLKKNSKELESQIQSLKSELLEIEKEKEREGVLRAIRDRNDRLSDLQSRVPPLQYRIKIQSQEVEKNEKKMNEIWNSVNMFPVDLYTCWFGTKIKTQKDAIRKLLDVSGSTELTKQFSELGVAR